MLIHTDLKFISLFVMEKSSDNKRTDLFLY